MNDIIRLVVLAIAPWDRSGSLSKMMRVSRVAREAATPILYDSVFLPDDDESARSSFWAGIDSPGSTKRHCLSHTRIMWAAEGLWHGVDDRIDAAALLPGLRTVVLSIEALKNPAKYDLHRFDHIEHVLFARPANGHCRAIRVFNRLDTDLLTGAFPNIKRLTIWPEPAVRMPVDVRVFVVCRYPSAWLKTLERIEVWPSTRWNSYDVDFSRGCAAGHNPLQWMPEQKLREFARKVRLVCMLPIMVDANPQERANEGAILKSMKAARSWLPAKYTRTIAMKRVKSARLDTQEESWTMFPAFGADIDDDEPDIPDGVTVRAPVELGRLISQRMAAWKGFLQS